jgi:outer membrane protein
MLASLGFPGFASAETLEEALASAYTTNPTLLAQRAQVRSSDEGVPQALSNWRPTVTLGGDAGRSKTVSNDQSPKSEINNPVDASITITQPLYRGGQTVAATREAMATVLAQRAALLSTEQTVFLNVVNAYTNVVQDIANVELNRGDEQVLQRQLDATRDRFRVGEVTRTDVSQAESRLSGAHADLVQAEGKLRSDAANYLTVVGHEPANLRAPARRTDLPVDVDAARHEAEQNNPDVAFRRYSYEAAVQGIDLQFGKLLPLLSLKASYVAAINQGQITTQGAAALQGVSGIYEKTATITLNLQVPIYQGGAEYSAVRQQKYVAGQARLTADETQHEAVEAADRYWQAMTTAQARIVSYTDQIRAANVALEGVRRESQVGSRTVLDVLNAEQELLSAKVNLVQAQHDETLAEFQLKNAVGQLTASAMRLPVEIYDPVKHYKDVRDQWIGTSVEPEYADQRK